MIIALEGVDGSGKTTTCGFLVQAIGAVYQATPPPEYMKLRRDIDSNASDWERYRFYLAGVQAASLELVRLQAEGKTVVLDRYWMTTVAYRRANGIPAIREHFGDIIEPDILVYLDVNPEVQLQRMVHRGLSVGDRRDASVMSAVRREYELLVVDVKGLVRIDTSFLSPHEVAEEVISAISPCFSSRR